MKKRNEEVSGFAYLAVFLAGMGFLACILCGCKQTEYVEVPVEKIREVEVQVDHWRTDTLRDSVWNQIYVKEYLKGDTVHHDSIEVRYAWKTKINTVYKDSICLRTDTVSVPYMVEKKLTKWEQTAINWFGTLVMVLLAVLAMIIVYATYKVRKIIK